VSGLPGKLETARLALRLPEAADVDALNAAIRASHAELTEWMPWARTPQSRDQTAEFCARARQRFRDEEGLDLLMVDRSDGSVLGGTGYPRLDWSVPRFEIGYWCRSDRTGRGLVTEAVWALAEHAFTALAAARVELFMDDENVRSYRVAERLGFRQEGLLRAECRNNQGGLRNTRVYAAVSLAELSAPQPR
jgi:RimJ/RimL family protein N-acetyltransferase